MPYILHLRKLLDSDCQFPTWPPSIITMPLDEAVAPAVHELLSTGYTNGFGEVASFEEWFQKLSGDAEYDPTYCVVIVDDEGPVGTALCWNTGFIKDLVIHPRRQHQGLGNLLLQHVFGLFWQAGARAVELKVHEHNEFALRLYKHGGMKPIGRTKVPAR